MAVVLGLAAATSFFPGRAGRPAPVVDGKALHIGRPIGNGTYGCVYWAQLAEERLVVKFSKGPSVEFADEYFDTERFMNERFASRGGQHRHLAPYLGSVTKDGARCLVWRAAGDRSLRDYLHAGDAGERGLAQALRVDPQDKRSLMRRMAQELYECLQTVHEQGVVHRDIKPENFVVDREEGCLRLIDFGSACEVEGFLVRRGLRKDRCPCSVLYAPPERFMDESAPFAYDVYSGTR